jgi:hypothetical protein
MEGLIMPVKRGEVIVCVKEFPWGHFIVGEKYRVSCFRMQGRYMGVRVRDHKRERKDFNFLVESNSYFWDYFDRVKAGSN